MTHEEFTEIKDTYAKCITMNRQEIAELQDKYSSCQIMDEFTQLREDYNQCQPMTHDQFTELRDIYANKNKIAINPKKNLVNVIAKKSPPPLNIGYSE